MLYYYIMKLKKHNCKRCNHSWLPRKESKPVVCPSCRSPYWDKERQVKKGGKNNE